MFQIDSDSLPYIAKLEIHYAAQNIMCLVDTYHVCIIRKYKPMFSGMHELERNARFFFHKRLCSAILSSGDLRLI